MPTTTISPWSPAQGTPAWLSPGPRPLPSTPPAWGADAWRPSAQGASRIDASPAGPDAIANLKALGATLWAQLKALWAQLGARG